MRHSSVGLDISLDNMILYNRRHDMCYYDDMTSRLLDVVVVVVAVVVVAQMTSLSESEAAAETEKSSSSSSRTSACFNVTYTHAEIVIYNIYRHVELQQCCLTASQVQAGKH